MLAPVVSSGHTQHDGSNSLPDAVPRTPAEVEGPTHDHRAQRHSNGCHYECRCQLLRIQH